MVERNWRVTFLLTNATSKPRNVPVLSSRALAKSGGKKFVGTLYLERAQQELNPGEALVAWALFQLPAGAEPEWVSIDVTSGKAPILALSVKHPIAVTAA
ncbi:hypothetical protein GCM10009777_10840 [Microbacterium pumilum]|uniref:DUF4352 domain-containing protein n=1 Tax=Microbacterium pumilum TaxID=344165 RepID=A0ABN2S2N1_9MICO